MEPKQISIEEIDGWVVLAYDDLIEDVTYLCPDKIWRKSDNDGTIPAEHFPSWKAAIQAVHAIGEMNTLFAEYDQRADHPPEELAKKIFFEIMEDMTDRRGVRQTWDKMEPEDKEELLRTNINIIRNNLPPKS